MTKTFERLAIAILAGTLSNGVAVAGEQHTKGREATSGTAKDIFYRPQASAPSQPAQRVQSAPLALRYQILLRRGDCVSIVPAGSQFVSGDQFRLMFQSNVDGFAYIFNRGSSGRGHVLFPDPQINAGQNHISAYADCTVPSTGWFEFDRLPGIEELLVFFSSRPLTRLDGPLGGLDGLAVSGTIEQQVWQQVVTTMVETHTTKDIVFVEEGQTVVPTPPLAQRVQPASPPAQRVQPTPPVLGRPSVQLYAQPPQSRPLPNCSPATYVGNVEACPNAQLIHTISLRHN